MIGLDNYITSAPESPRFVELECGHMIDTGENSPSCECCGSYSHCQECLDWYLGVCESCYENMPESDFISLLEAKDNQAYQEHIKRQIRVVAELAKEDPIITTDEIIWLTSEGVS